MDFYTAKTQFNNYLKDYDCHNDKIRLKIVHTYGVVKESADIAARMKLSEEDTSLAKMIALLHDIGRFEQLKQFDSFLPDTMDHAAYGVKILFDNAPHQNLIRNFIPESDFDEIIRISIAKHSDFKLDGISDARTLLHAKIIRDADKLDNCRVKLEDRLETFMDTSAEETGASAISPKVRDSILLKSRSDDLGLLIQAQIFDMDQLFQNFRSGGTGSDTASLDLGTQLFILDQLPRVFHCKDHGS